MFDPTDYGGPGGYPRCCGCGDPIFDSQQSVRIDFDTDPHGLEGLSGVYHKRCSRPFSAFAKVMNLNWFGKF